MNQRVLIRHSSGGKASTVEEFPISGSKEWTFGRDASCDVRFDKDRDEFVSRRHMKIVVDDPDRLEFSIVDLSALNGTFVNRRRVTGSVKVHPGDIVQLGAGGPEFTFDLSPAAASPQTPTDLEATRIEDLSKLFSARDTPAQPSPPIIAPIPEPAQSEPTGRRRRQPSRAALKKRIAGIGVLILLIGAAILYFVGLQRIGGIKEAARAAIARGAKVFRSDSRRSREDIATLNSESLVTIQTAWRLIDSANGRQLRQIYIPNRRDGSNGNTPPLIPGAGSDLPVFVLLTGNRLQPLLTLNDNSAYKPIGGLRRGAGFVVGSDGQILTSRSLTTPWNAPYEWLPGDSAGVVAVFDQQSKLARTAVIARRQFPRWFPVDIEFVLDDAFHHDTVRMNHKIRGIGKSDSLTISFGDRHPGVPGSPVNASDSTGLAVVQVDGRMATRKIPVATDFHPKPGDELALLSPPGIAKLSAIRSDGGYELAIGTARAGSAGAPIFDQRGRVVAVESENDPTRPDQVLAIPIRQALESVGHTLSLR